MIIISEKDLYKYVLHPDDLSIEKRNYVIDNIEQFADQIIFLEHFKNNLTKDIPAEIFNEILENIESHSKIVTIPLIKLPENKSEDSEYITLAADSPNNLEEVHFSTFQSENKDFLVKMNTTSIKTNIYILGNNLSNEKNYSLIIKPSGKKINIDINNQPLVVDPIEDTESLVLMYH